MNRSPHVPTRFQIVSGPSRWDLMEAMFDSRRRNKVLGFVIAVGKSEKRIKVDIHLESLRIPEGDIPDDFDYGEVEVTGEAVNLRLLNRVHAYYCFTEGDSPLSASSGHLSFS